MSFSNALNEAARDSDVYRMFSRGKGFLATAKCQKCFHLGCIADFIAVGAALSRYAHWAFVLCVSIIVVVVGGRIFLPTKRLLFANASIVDYWREELGGK